MSSQEQNKNFKSILKKYFRKDQLLLLPNIICYIRVLLTVGAITIYTLGATNHFPIVGGNEFGFLFIAASLFVIATYTDFLDGFIARKFDMRSDLGKVLDPICDVITIIGMCLALCVALLYQGKFYSVFLLFVGYIVKELVILCEDVYLAKRGLTFKGAKWYGKVSSFGLYMCVLFLLVYGPGIYTLFVTLNMDKDIFAHILVDTFSTLGALFSLFGALMYTIESVKIVKENKKEI